MNFDYKLFIKPSTVIFNMPLLNEKNAPLKKVVEHQKIMRNLFVPLLLLTLVACKKNEATIEEIKSIQDSTEKVTQTPERINSIDEIISQFISKKKQVEEKLKTISKEEANLLFEEYRSECANEIKLLSNKENHFLENYYTYFAENSPPDSIKTKIDLYKKADLAFFEVGEGIVEIRNKTNFFYSIFEKYVTADYKKYLEILKNEDDVLYSSDGGLVIPFKDIGERIITWENFLKKYPESKLTKSAKDLYKVYQIDYLFGLDNTPTIDIETGKLIEETEIEYKRFLKVYPESPTCKLIQIFKNNLKHTDISALKDLIIKEQQKQIH